MDDDEIQSHLTNGCPSYFDLDEAFGARMRAAITAGLENAPIGVVTTKKPRAVASTTRSWNGESMEASWGVVSLAVRIIERTIGQDIALDPCLGGGLAAREAARLLARPSRA
jgi:hypothetical protein